MSRELEEEGREALGKPPIVHNPCRRPQTGGGENVCACRCNSHTCLFVQHRRAFKVKRVNELGEDSIYLHYHPSIYHHLSIQSCIHTHCIHPASLPPSLFFLSPSLPLSPSRLSVLFSFSSHLLALCRKTSI